MVENGADIIALVDPDGRLLRANPAAESTLGWKVADLIGQSMLTLIHPDDLERVCQALAEAVTSPDSHPEVTYRMRTNSGTWVSLSSTAANQLHEPALGAIVVNARDVTDRENDLNGLVASLAHASEFRDPYTAGHQRAVGVLTRKICSALGLPYQEADRITRGAELHDIGKIAIPAEILCKPGKHTDAEWMIMKQHPTTGYEILSSAQIAQPISDIVLHHHERLDGSGYPHGLTGEDIRAGARIVAVADTIDAICSHRPYRPSLGPDFAIDVLLEGRGRIYDRDVVDAAIAAAIPELPSAAAAPPAVIAPMSAVAAVH